MTQPPIHIIGKNGKTGSQVNERLQALGRPAADFKTYVQKTMASGIWKPLAVKESA